MDKKPVVYIDIKHVAITPSYRDTNNFIENMIAESWLSSLKGDLDETKQKSLKFTIGEIVEVLKPRQISTHSLDQIVTDTKKDIASFFTSLPSLESIALAKNGADQFEVNANLKSLVKEISDSGYEVCLIHLQSRYTFKQQVWQQAIANIESELSCSVKSFKSADELKSLCNNTEKSLLLTARPKLFAFVLKGIDNPLKLVYLNHLFMKLNYKYKYETYVVNEIVPIGEISCLSQLPGLIDFLKQKEAHPNQKIYTVGYNFVLKKFTLMHAKNRSLSASFPVLFVPVDLRFRLNRKIDVFYHKATDFTKDSEDYEAQLKLTNFHDIYKQSSELGIKFLDPPGHFKIISDRIGFQDTFVELLESQAFDKALNDYCKQNNCVRVQFKVPIAKQLPPSSKDSDVQKTITDLSLQYPLIIKTVVSCASSTSHKMAVAMKPEGLRMVEANPVFTKESHILQELINHDGRIFKVYVVGEEVRIMQKQSIPNITDESVGSTHFFFDSQQGFDSLECFKNKLSFTEEDIDMGSVRVLCQFIRDELNLTLFGADLVRESKSGIYYLIDINYFPGYKNMNKDFGEVIKRHIINTMDKESK